MPETSRTRKPLPSEQALLEWGRRAIAYLQEHPEREPMDGYRKAELIYDFREIAGRAHE